MGISPSGDSTLTELQPSEVRLLQDRTNLRPRKMLGYTTPAEAYAQAYAAA
ncbi:MAG: hypothetical protein OXI38_14735 [Bacteroidota bacterium]|nr:hypothetical protein [Bacteroidota bacterium]